MPASTWSDWTSLPLDVPPRDAAVFTEIIDGGQAFRWKPQPDGSWTGIWGANVAQVRFHGGKVQWRAPLALAPQVATEIGPYFAADRDYAAMADAMPWRSDPHLERCVESLSGLRILHQPFGETLLGFLCSATKQIVQIRQMMSLLAERHGAPLSPFASLHRLPTWPELARIPEPALRSCLLGFRAKYIHETALFLAAHPGWLEQTEQLPYPEAKARLSSLPGVGEKIADCVLLYGGGRMESFPTDVWIIRSMANHYGLDGWKPAQIAHFGRTHFGPFAGLAQQYLFAWERKQSRS